MINSFSNRHIGPSESEKKAMLQTIGLDSISTLIDKTIPQNIRLNGELDVADALTEAQYLQHITALGNKNKVLKSFIGLGYHETIVPSVILRNVLENPGWYTAYTPYQAEIAQGRLEALLNFQTMVLDLSGMEIANASLLDEGTAAAEAMIMFYNNRSRNDIKEGKNVFFISQDCFPQTLEVVHGRALNLGIELLVGDETSYQGNENCFGALIQYPTALGEIRNIEPIISLWHSKGIQVAVATDLLALSLLKSPGEMGADVVLGSSQRFGVPMGFGGPHAAFFASKDLYKRNMPGRIIGVSKDSDDNLALRMALQTREQHIKRDKATSNICTAQALLAVMASMYAVYHGPNGIKEIAHGVNHLAKLTYDGLKKLGFSVGSAHFFDTVCVHGIEASTLSELAEQKGLNFNYFNKDKVCISFGEPHSIADVHAILAVFADLKGVPLPDTDASSQSIPSSVERKSAILSHPVFNQYHSESKMMRYLKRLENKDLSLVHSMIALGSCTMKLNAASELIPITNSQFCNMHPFAPKEQASGYYEMLDQLEKDLCACTGFAAVSLQPNSGAQGEYAGLMVIKAFHEANGDFQRKKIIIPSSAHGTNPASAVMAGFEVIVTSCDINGNIDIEELEKVALENKNELAGLMVTYPSTHGVFEEGIQQITSIIHDNGGQVYMDGANMNAQVGLTNPGNIGADVCHLNLHKTFAIPHGGGGPGVGPICVNEKLVPFLPTNPIIPTGGDQAITAISAAPFGSALVCLISYGYICMLGAEGVTDATKYAILNANYMKTRLESHYPVLYSGEMGRAAHEMILDCRAFKEKGIEVTDIAKRLMDYGFHAPTVSFPVAGTLMIEPTESEDLGELDRFCDAMISIRKEIEAATKEETNNVLHNAPHTLNMLTADTWVFPYTREQAAYPLEYVAENKFWPSVRRVDDAYGDRNLVCSCAPIEAYM